jgi:hypothetical protein
MKAQHSTLNIQHQTNPTPMGWMLNVECWMFDVRLPSGCEFSRFSVKPESSPK